MLELIAQWLFTAAGLVVATRFVPGIAVTSYSRALLVALVLGLLSITVRPLLTLLTLPVNILTLGLFSFVISGIVLWLAGVFVPGFVVDGLLAGILGAIVISVVVWIGMALVNVVV